MAGWGGVERGQESNEKRGRGERKERERRKEIKGGRRGRRRLFVPWGRKGKENG